MIPCGSTGNTYNFGPLSSAQNHYGGAAGGRRSDSWVWPPPPRIKNSAQVINNNGGTCSCASRLQRQQQQQQQQQQQKIVNINSLLTPADHSKRHLSSSISTSVNHSVSPLRPENSNPRPLRYLFCKELTPSDIRKRYKIIIPRREAEIHFPLIDSRSGVRIRIEDYETKQTWGARVRYRITNNSKIHSLEGTREFLQIHDLNAGDYIAVYKDDLRQRYVISAIKERRRVSKVKPLVTNTGSMVFKGKPLLPPSLNNCNNSSVVFKGKPSLLLSLNNCNSGSVDSKNSNLGIISSRVNNSYMYLNKLSDFSIVDEMEEVATPCTPYPYGNATWSGGQVSCELHKLAPLQTFKFVDLPMDYIFRT